MEPENNQNLYLDHTEFDIFEPSQLPSFPHVFFTDDLLPVLAVCSLPYDDEEAEARAACQESPESKKFWEQNEDGTFPDGILISTPACQHLPYGILPRRFLDTAFRIIACYEKHPTSSEENFIRGTFPKEDKEQFQRLAAYSISALTRQFVGSPWSLAYLGMWNTEITEHKTFSFFFELATYDCDSSRFRIRYKPTQDLRRATRTNFFDIEAADRFKSDPHYTPFLADLQLLLCNIKNFKHKHQGRCYLALKDFRQLFFNHTFCSENNEHFKEQLRTGLEMLTCHSNSEDCIEHDYRKVLNFVNIKGNTYVEL